MSTKAYYSEEFRVFIATCIRYQKISEIAAQLKINGLRKKFYVKVVKKKQLYQLALIKRWFAKSLKNKLIIYSSKILKEIFQNTILP